MLSVRYRLRLERVPSGITFVLSTTGSDYHDLETQMINRGMVGFFTMLYYLLRLPLLKKRLIVKNALEVNKNLRSTDCLD